MGGKNLKTDGPVLIDLSSTSTSPISIGTDTVNCFIDILVQQLI